MDTEILYLLVFEEEDVPIFIVFLSFQHFFKLPALVQGKASKYTLPQVLWSLSH
jgi:hypothetical protein